VEEATLKTETIQIERKTFIFTLKENPRGRFLRITEDVNGRRDNVIIPSTGLEDFRKIVDDMVKAAGELPSQETRGDDVFRLRQEARYHALQPEQVGEFRASWQRRNT
jgi:hypothetical protein